MLYLFPVTFLEPIMTSIKSRVDLYRQKQESNGSVRADLYIPVELKERVKKISTENNWKYLETLAALAALGTEVFENSSAQELEENKDFVLNNITLLNSQKEDFSASACSASAQSLKSEIAGRTLESYSSTEFSKVSKTTSHSVLKSFIENRKDPKK